MDFISTPSPSQGEPDPSTQIVMVDVDNINPSPENDRLYTPCDPQDPEIIDLAKSLRADGMLTPLLVTADHYILSGHRRHAAALLARIHRVPVQVVNIRRADDIDEFTRLLTVCNKNRIKSIDVLIREAVVLTNPRAAYRALKRHRSKNPTSRVSRAKGGKIVLGKARRRAEITDAKRPMLDAVKAILRTHHRDLPMSDRQIHYRLLNLKVLKHAKKRSSWYRNDRNSYADLCDLLTRARLTGEIPWEHIVDETRVLVTTNCHPNPQPFMRKELDRFMRFYWRDLQQSQPHHVEIVIEKLTIRSIVDRVSLEYCIPMSVSRGYSSIRPRYDMAERFRASGKEKLIVLFVSDFDPDGENIAESYAASLRDDMGIRNIEPIKVALNFEQVQKLKLPPAMKAKKGASKYKDFVKKYGPNVFEVESLSPDQLRRILGDAIDSVMDLDLLEKEREAEAKDAATIEAWRNRIHRVFDDVVPDDDD